MPDLPNPITIEGCPMALQHSGGSVVALEPLTLGRWRVTFAAPFPGGAPNTIDYDDAY